MVSPINTRVVRAGTAALILAAVSVMPDAFAQSFQDLSVGANHICAIDADGTVECTTDPNSRRLLPPDTLPPMQDIAAGQEHTCGVTLDGSVQCWGTNSFDALQVPRFDAPVQSIASGFSHTCAVDANNRVQCWGLNSNGQLDVPDVEGGFVKVDLTRSASCGIDTRGDIHCWSTDSFFNPGTPIAGPFVDLDLDSNQACGLRADGDIQCWAARERLNLAAPQNGPYTDLTVTNSAICGLRTDQLLDCSFAAPTMFELDVRQEDYPLDVRFSAIERSAIQFGGVPICGIRAENGSIDCFGGSGNGAILPSPPGAPNMDARVTAADVTLIMTAKVYGRDQVELFWSQLPALFPQIFVEIYRDDELLTTTGNNFSFYDTDPLAGDETVYRVRTVDQAGNVGRFSNTVRVNRASFQVDTGQQSGNNPGTPEMRVRNVTVRRTTPSTNTYDEYFLTWEIDNAAGLEIAGYEIRVNDEPVDFVNALSYIGDGLEFNQCRVYSVAAISPDGTILDYGTAALGRFANRCPDDR